MADSSDLSFEGVLPTDVARSCCWTKGKEKNSNSKSPSRMNLGPGGIRVLDPPNALVGTGSKNLA